MWKRIVLAFALGFLIGAVIAARSVGRLGRGSETRPPGVAKPFATSLYYGDSARHNAERAGVAVPSTAFDIFYAIMGFNEVVEWIAFSVPVCDLWPVAERLTGKHKGDFQARESPPDPCDSDGKPLSLLFNPPRDRNVLSVDVPQRPDIALICDVDEASSRVFIRLVEDDWRKPR